MNLVKPSYGVIVARCQVPELHAGHLALFREVKARHNRVILFLGVHPYGTTYTNPLDYETRKAMVQAKFPEFFIFPLVDTMTDEQWSRNLDSKIREIADYGDVTLYGSRDSFIPHYSGQYKPVELTLPVELKNVSGTDIRAKLTDEIMESAAFRAGVIYGRMNQRPGVKPTVDVVIIHRSMPVNTKYVTNREVKYFLLGRKPGEPAWRFIGGHAEPTTDDYETDARNEAMEESGLDILGLRYIGSARIPDWRLKNEPDQIKTLIFVGESMTMGGRGADDIQEVKWFKDDELHEGLFVETHKILFNVVRKHFNLDALKEGNNATATSN